MTTALRVRSGRRCASVVWSCIAGRRAVRILAEARHDLIRIEPSEAREIPDLEDEDQQTCDAGAEEEVTCTDQDAERGDGPDGRCRCEPSRLSLRCVQHETSAKEPDTGDDAGDHLLGTRGEVADTYGGDRCSSCRYHGERPTADHVTAHLPLETEREPERRCDCDVAEHREVRGVHHLQCGGPDHEVRAEAVSRCSRNNRGAKPS